MKLNQSKIKIMIMVLATSSCFSSEHIPVDGSAGSLLLPELLIRIGCAAKDKTRDEFRKTSKFFNQELSIKSFKKLIELPLLNTLKLGYFACDAAWKRDSDLLQKIMRHMKNIHQHYQPLYTRSTENFLFALDLSNIVKIRMPHEYDAIAQLARHYSNYEHFPSKIGLYVKTRYACYNLAFYGKGLQKLNHYLERYPEIYGKYYEQESHLGSLLNFLDMAIHKDSAICAIILLPYIQNVIATKEETEKIETYRDLLRKVMRQKKDKVFEVLVANNIFCRADGAYFYYNRLYTMLDWMIEYVNSVTTIPSDGCKYIDICRNYGWRTKSELRSTSNNCILL